LLSKPTEIPAERPTATCSDESPPVAAAPFPTEVVSTSCVELMVALSAILNVVDPLSISASALLRATEIAANGTIAIPPLPDERASDSVVEV